MVNQTQMNYDWVIEQKNGKVTPKKDKGVLTPYHTRSSHVPRDKIQTVMLQDEQGNPKAILDNIPDGAEIFQRHRYIPINYHDRYHTITESIPESFDPNTRQLTPAKSVTRTLPEWTYMEFWMIGYRRRVGASVEVYFKAVYPDGKIDEHHGWGEKPWLFEPDWFSEEQV